MNDFDFLRKELMDLNKKMQGKLLSEDFDRIYEYAINNELGLGFEVLCTQLYEYNIPISKEYYRRLISYNNLLGFSESDISFMKDLILLNDLDESM